MNGALLWIVPPAVGAVIGFVTNAIAIKMLFRPLAEKRLFGLRIPFTPGILPRQRNKLAANIGKMVSRELLTESIVRERLRSPQFETLIRRSVASYTEKLLSSTISEAASFASNLPIVRNGGADAVSGSDIGRSISTVVDRFVASEAFSGLVRSVIRQTAASIGAKSPSAFFGSGAGLPSAADLIDHFLASLATDDAERRISSAIERFLRDGVESGRQLSSYLPETAAESVSRFVDFLYPMAVEAGLRFLDQPGTRRELEAKGKVILRDAILELNAFQRFFVSAAQYDKTLTERMPAIIQGFVERIAEMVRAEENRQRFIETVLHTADNLISKPAGEALAVFGAEPDVLARKLAARLRSLLASDSFGSALRALVGGFFAKLSDEPIERILRERLGLDLPAVADMAAFSLIGHIRSEGSLAVPRLVAGFLQERGNDTLASFLKIDVDEKEKWDALIAEKAVSMVDERVSGIIESLDVQRMVSERIDALEMEDVERIVLDVLADQLKWIDVFGAILGALMGLFQAGFSFFMSR